MKKQVLFSLGLIALCASHMAQAATVNVFNGCRNYPVYVIVDRPGWMHPVMCVDLQPHRVIYLTSLDILQNKEVTEQIEIFNNLSEPALQTLMIDNLFDDYWIYQLDPSDSTPIVLP